MRNLAHKPQTGYSLIEMIAILALATIMVQVGTSGLLRLASSLKITLSVNTLAHTLNLARQVAFATGSEVVLCKSRSLTDCEAEAEWHDGWVVFDNLDQDHPPRRDANETIRLAERPVAGAQIRANRDAFVMRPFGSRATNGTLVWCAERYPTLMQSLIVSYTGKTRIERDATDPNLSRCAGA